MEAEELTVGRVHHGHNIRRFRIEKNMNQEVLSQLVHLSQSAVSKYEQMRVIDDEMLHRFSRALGVPFEYLKSLEEDAQTVVFENNTVNNNDQASANIGGYVEENNRVNNYNPIEKITELYERLLKEKDEKYAALERRLQNVETPGYRYSADYYNKYHADDPNLPQLIAAGQQKLDELKNINTDWFHELIRNSLYRCSIW